MKKPDIRTLSDAEPEDPDLIRARRMQRDAAIRCLHDIFNQIQNLIHMGLSREDIVATINDRMHAEEKLTSKIVVTIEDC